MNATAIRDELPPPFNWRRNLIFVSAAQFLSIAGFGFALPFIPFFIRDRLGVTVESELSMWVGLFAAAGHLALGIFAPVWGFIADIYGRRKMVLRANFTSMALLPLTIFVPSTGWLIALRFLISCFSGTVTASQALVASTTPQDKIGLAMGTITSAVGSGNLIGMLLGALVVDRFGYNVAFTASGVLFGVAGLLVLFGAQEDFTRTTTLRAKLRGMHLALPRFGGLWLLLILLAATGFVTAFERPFVPQLVEIVSGHKGAKFWTSVVLAGSALAGIVAGSVMGRLADRFSPPRVGVWSALLAGLMTIPLGLAGSLSLLIGARMGMAFFAAGLDPVFQIWLVRNAPVERRALVLGWGTTFRACGWFLCATAAGGVAMLGGVRLVFLASAGFFLLLVPCIHFTSRRIARS
jgi:DHA1 family multidrug resistance protein-like MFS transporter